MIESVKVTIHITCDAGAAENKSIEVSHMISLSNAVTGFGDDGERIVAALVQGKPVKTTKFVGGISMRFLLEPIVRAVEI